MIKLNEQSPVKQMYLLLKSDTNRNLTYNLLNWAFQIKDMLDQLGFTKLWIYQGNILTIRLNTIKQRLLDHYYQTWYSNINNSRRPNTYCIFKHTFNLEPYLDSITNKRFIITLSRFRLSSHKLEIERGRYHNIDRENSICTFCNSKAIENEYHFLLICPLYRDIRKQSI